MNYVTDSSAAEETAKEINAENFGAAIAVKADVSSVNGAEVLLGETLRAFGKVQSLHYSLNSCSLPMDSLIF